MEVHAELDTSSKMFSPAPVAFGGEPNTRVALLDLGLPGTLPVPNKEAIDMVLKTALALNCNVPERSVFHRKNYFYPDLPKGYQISQYEETNPIGYHGFLEIPATDGGLKRIRIKRVHLEEDTGKLMHLPGGGTGVDYNRAGTPLMEIVTDFPPDIGNATEAKEYLVQLRRLLLFLGVCDGKMEQGSLRCEPNISIRKEGEDKLGVKTELKNLNSFKAVEQGIEFEINRQIEALERGEALRQETRGWNEDKQESFIMRIKEDEQEYRYFPDPDLPPLTFSRERVSATREFLPELPLVKEARFRDEYQLSEYDASVLTSEPARAAYFEDCVRAGCEPKTACNWINGELTRLLNETGETIDPKETDRSLTKVEPKHIAEIESLIASGAISGKIAKTVFEEVFRTGSSPAKVVEEQGLTQISDDSALLAVIQDVLSENPGQLEAYLGGKESLTGFFVGQIMRKTSGQANPQMVQDLLRTELEKRKGG